MAMEPTISFLRKNCRIPTAGNSDNDTLVWKVYNPDSRLVLRGP